jgi:hypothetical protein
LVNQIGAREIFGANLHRKRCRGCCVMGPQGTETGRKSRIGRLERRIARLEFDMLPRPERIGLKRYIACSDAKTAMIEREHPGPKIIRVMVSPERRI